MANVIELEGQRFGRLTVTGYAGKRPIGGAWRVRWHCLCDCGGTTTTMAQALRSGKTQSCGCIGRDLARERTRYPFRTMRPGDVVFVEGANAMQANRALHCCRRRHREQMRERRFKCRTETDGVRIRRVK